MCSLMQDAQVGPLVGMGGVLFWILLVAASSLLVWFAVRLLSRRRRQLPPEPLHGEQGVASSEYESRGDRSTDVEMKHELES